MRNISKLILGISIVGVLREESRKTSTCLITQVNKKTSNKPKQKGKSFKSNSTYKSTKPIKSKSVGKFRNKSNL